MLATLKLQRTGRRSYGLQSQSMQNEMVNAVGKRPWVQCFRRITSSPIFGFQSVEGFDSKNILRTTSLFRRTSTSHAEQRLRSHAGPRSAYSIDRGMLEHAGISHRNYHWLLPCTSKLWAPTSTAVLLDHSSFRTRIQTRQSVRRQAYASRSRAARVGTPPLEDSEDPKSPDDLDEPLKTIEDFNALTKKGRATIEDAHRFLEKSKQAINHLPLDERRAAAEKVGGNIVLRWLMEQKFHNLSNEFVNLISWFAHAEGHDEQIMDWIKLAAKDATPPPWNPHGRHLKEWTWARRLEGSIIAAHVEWSPDGTTNSAIKRLKKHVTGSDLPQIIGTTNGEMVVYKALQSDTALPCNVELFNWFTDFYLSNISKISGTMHPELSAILPLFHPINADPMPMLDFIKAKHANSAPTVPQLTQRHRIVWAEKYLLRTCFLLRLRDKLSDAEWLESYIQEHFPKAWVVRDQWFFFAARDPKLQQLLKAKSNASWIPQTFVPRRRGEKQHRTSAMLKSS